MDFEILSLRTAVAPLVNVIKAIPAGFSCQSAISFAALADITSVFPLPGQASRYMFSLIEDDT